MKALVSLLLLLASSGAYPCSCDHVSFDEQTARGAEHVFIFRMIEATFTSENDGSFIREDSWGSIRFVESIRGNGESFTRIHFNTSECCGTHLDVGHYYIAFVSGPGPSFLASVSMIADINDVYAEDSDYPRSEDGVISRVRRLLDGTLSIDAALRGLARANDFHMAPPPPPCPGETASPET